MVQLSWTGLGAAIATFMVIAALLWWFVPKLQMRSIVLGDPKARADIEDNFRKTVGQALGGIAVLIGAGVAYLQFRQQQQAAHDLLISNQVARGFEQLAGHNLTMRLGGIYGLEGVMNASEQYHQPVLEALCAFVREGTIGKEVGKRPAADVQAALTVIGRRADGPGQVNLAGVDIRGADLYRAKLNHADLNGANLSGTELSGADLVGANLAVANLNGTRLDGANLSGADITQKQLDAACGAGASLPLPAGQTLSVCTEPSSPGGGMPR